LLYGLRLLYNEKVRAFYITVIFFVCAAGCTSQFIHAKTSSPMPSQSTNTSSSGSDVSVVRRVTLPYTFMRHGVEIRINSVELADSRVLVNLALQETKGVSFDFSVSTLLQALTSTGQALAYAGYTLMGTTQTAPTIHLAGLVQVSITLVYQSPPEISATSADYFQLRFPTGKYWSSQTSE